MDQETLFTATKWPILQAIADGKKSPQEIATVCKTSLANVSQQLRMLELAGVVLVERLPNRDKGLPRILYSLPTNTAFIIAAMPGLVEKKFLLLSALQKSMLAVWLQVEPAKQYFVEKALWNLEKHLPSIQGIYYDPKILSSISLIIVTDTDLKKHLPTYTMEKEGSSMHVTFNVLKPTEHKLNKQLCKLFEK